MSTPFDLPTEKQRYTEIAKSFKKLKHQTHKRPLTPWGHIPTIGGTGSGGGISATTLAALTDTDIPTTTPTPDGQVLTWVTADLKWKPKALTAATTPAPNPIADFLKWWNETDNTIIVFLRDTVGGTLAKAIKKLGEWWNNLSYPWLRGADTGILDSLARVIWGERFTKNETIGSVQYGPTIKNYKDVTLAITANSLVTSSNTRARTFWEYLEVNFREIGKIIKKWWDESDNPIIKFLRDTVGKTLADSIKKVATWWKNLSYPWKRGEAGGIWDSLARTVWGERFTKNQFVGPILFGPAIEDYKDVTVAITASTDVTSSNTRARTFWEYLEVNFREIGKIIFKWWDESDNPIIKFLRDTVGKTLADSIKKVATWWKNLSYPWLRGSDTGILDSLARVIWGERFTKNETIGSVQYGPTIVDHKDVTVAITADPLVTSTNTRARTFWEFLEVNVPKFTSAVDTVITGMLEVAGIIGREIKNAITFVLGQLGGKIVDGFLDVVNGVWSWAAGSSYTAGSGTSTGANQSLSNLLNVQINKPLIFKPNSDLNPDNATNSIGFDSLNNMYFKIRNTGDNFHFMAGGRAQLEINNQAIRLVKTSTDPATDGEIRLVGTSIRVKSKGHVYHLDDIGSGSGTSTPSVSPGTLPILKVSSDPSSASALDTAFGNEIGCIGISMTGSPTSFPDRDDVIFWVKTAAYWFGFECAYLVTGSKNLSGSASAEKRRIEKYTTSTRDEPASGTYTTTNSVEGDMVLHQDSDDSDDGFVGLVVGYFSSGIGVLRGLNFRNEDKQISTTGTTTTSVTAMGAIQTFSASSSAVNSTYLDSAVSAAEGAVGYNGNVQRMYIKANGYWWGIYMAGT